jgi:hypothetical protein
MKTKFLKFALPIGMGLMLTVITIIGIASITFSSCSDDRDHCPSKDNPLTCPNPGMVKYICCPSGFGYLCDGACSTCPCPSGTTHSSVCYED